MQASLETVGYRIEARRFAALKLHAIFFASGAAALIYQVCWQRLLSVYYGVGPVSIAIVVSAFMLGLGIGALLGGYLADRSANLLRLYALVEAGIGVFGVASIAILAQIGQVTAGSSHALTFVCAFGFLLVPTALMGMTLPIAVGILRRIDSDILRDTSAYYFSNTLGAAFGAVLCGYVLLSLYGIAGAIGAAVFLNVALAVSIFLIARQTGSPLLPPRAAGEAPGRVRRLVLALLVVNGFLAIGYQIVWYRIATVLLKDSAYSFSTILCIFLLGIGLGSLWLHHRGLTRWKGREFDLYLLLNALIGVASLGAVALLYVLAPHKPVAGLVGFSHAFDILPWVGDPTEWGGKAAYLRTALTFALMLLWPALLMFVPTLLMGAAFPVGIGLAAEGGAARGASIGYAATIAGNTLGGLVTQFLLLPWAGTTAVLAGFCALQVGILLLAPRRPKRGPRGSLAFKVLPLAGVVLALLVAPSSAEFYRRIHQSTPGANAHFAEGLEGVAMVFEDGKKLNNVINGSSHGTRPGGGYAHEALVALSYLESPAEVLVIGFGAGALVNALQADDRVKRITVVELNETAFDNLMKVPEIARGVADSRITFVFDDGRRFLHRTRQKFDLISMDPIRTRSAFSNNLYSRDFFELARGSLNDGGILLVWCGDDWTSGVKKTLATVFDEVRLYSYFMVASSRRKTFSPAVYDSLREKIPADAAADMQQYRGPVVGDRQSILHSTRSVPVNTDAAPYSEYFLGSLARRPARAQ